MGGKLSVSSKTSRAKNEVKIKLIYFLICKKPGHECMWVSNQNQNGKLAYF